MTNTLIHFLVNSEEPTEHIEMVIVQIHEFEEVISNKFIKLYHFLIVYKFKPFNFTKTFPNNILI